MTEIDMKLFLVEGVVFRYYPDQANSEDRVDDTRLVMAADETAAKIKYEKWWDDQSVDQDVSYCGFSIQVKGVIE